MRERPRQIDGERGNRLANRVYVNRLLDFRRITAIGLDLDHTLAVYDDQAVNELAFIETCRNLREIKGYPSSVTGLQYDNSKISRGIIADAVRGNLLKLDFRDRVCRAWRGASPLSDGEIAALYSGDSLDPDDGNYAEIHSPFDLPAGRLFALLREPPYRSQAWSQDYRSLLVDIREMLDRSHTQGDLKRHITGDPGRFVEKRPEVADMIARFRAAGKKTFLLTNSGLAYTTELLGYLFDGGAAGTWPGLFDAVVVDADKPRFFESNREENVSAGERDVLFPPGPPAVQRGGSALTLERLLDSSGGDVLFIGDNPAADCIAARSRGWRTAMVVPELETEPFAPGSATDAPNSDRDDDGKSVFRDNGIPTRFSRILQENADVFSARIEAILSAGPNSVFTPD